MLADLSSFCFIVLQTSSVVIARTSATPQGGASLGRQYCEKWHLERLRAICEFSTRSPQHEPASGMDEAGLAREATLAKSARAKAVGRTKQLTSHGLLLCPKGSPLAPKLKIMACRFFCLNSAAIPLPGMGKFVATAMVLFAACGFPNISSIRIELVTINRPIIIETPDMGGYDHFDRRGSLRLIQQSACRLQRMVARFLRSVNQLFVPARPLEWMSGLVGFPTSAGSTKHRWQWTR